MKMDFHVVWEYEIGKPWAAVRLLNGNTLITSERDRAAREVNRAGEVVWVLNDWRELGPATAVQILDDSGDPEVPGECER